MPLMAALQTVSITDAGSVLERCASVASSLFSELSCLFPRVHFGSGYSRQGSLIKNVSAPAELQRQKLLLFHLFVCTYEIVDFCTNIVCVQFGREERGKKINIKASHSVRGKNKQHM